MYDSDVYLEPPDILSTRGLLYF